MSEEQERLHEVEDIRRQEYLGRVERTRKAANENGLDGLFIYSDAWRKGNARYLSGFSPFAIAPTPANASLVFLPIDGDPILFVGWPIMIDEAKEITWMKDVRAMQDIPQAVTTLKGRQKISRIGICGMDIIPLTVYEMIKRALPDAELKSSDIIYRLRLVKSEAEVRLMKRAAEIADRGMTAAINAISEGTTELEIARTLELQIMRDGADVYPTCAFSTVVLSGQRSEWIIGRGGRRKIRKGDLVLLDFGTIYKGYTCDIARTAGFKISEDQERVLEAVTRGALIGEEAVRPGIRIDEVDRVIRDFMKEKGYEKFFAQTGYHATGMEQADVLPDGKDTVLMPNMTLNVLSALFVPRIGGARNEDNMVVTNSGAQRLTQSDHTFML